MAWDGKPKNIVANEVQKHRMARGWSQAQLAAKCQIAGWDVSRGIIAGIEGRMRCVSDFEVVILAAVLGTTLGDLYPKEIDWVGLGLPDLKRSERGH